MASVRATVNRIDELERNGFEKKQATVLAMAIDETVEDRLKGVVEHFDSRLDGINAQLNSQKYQIALITVTFGAALLGILAAAYEYVLKPMIG